MAATKSKIDKNKLFELLETFKLEIVNALGKSTDPLWSLCSKLKIKMSPSELFLITQNNRYNCHRIIGLIEKQVVSEYDARDHRLFSCPKYVIYTWRKL